MRTIQLGSISVIHSDWLPYATGCLISHCLRDDEIRNNNLFLTPWYSYRPIEEYQDQFANIDILGLTCYVWNQNYNDRLSRAYKETNPNGLVIYGGPNVPVDQDIASRFALKRPWVDLHFVGPGEKNFSGWLRDGTMEGTFSQYHYTVGNIRTYQTDQLPTPYTDGVFDPILETGVKVKASFETNRGCPYACAFCDWGGQAQSKLTRFDRDGIYQQIDKIYSHQNVHEIEILDANFGIVEDDLRTIDHMIAMQRKHQNRIYVSYSGLAKNGSRWLPGILDRIFNDLPIRQRNLKISFQTHDLNTLDVIQRSNIDNTRLYPLIDSYKARNIPTTSELIIALPGETADGWLHTLDHNHRLGIDYIRTYFLNLVPNTPMYLPDYQAKHGIRTKLLRFPYSFSKLGYKTLHTEPEFNSQVGEDHEEIEIIHACNSFDIDELVRMFDRHWFYHNLVNSNGIRELVRDVRGETLDFLGSLERMPLMSSLIESNRLRVKTIFRDEPVTNIEDLGTYLYFSRCMRTDDVYQLWNSREQVVEELGQLYGKDAVAGCVSKWHGRFTMDLYGTDANLRSRQDG